jgi:hypothetical protein
VIQLLVFFALLFCCAMICHGELSRSKPDPAHLTTFYLTLAAGGAAGGVFVGLIAPRLLVINAEVSMAMVSCTPIRPDACGTDARAGPGPACCWP